MITCQHAHQLFDRYLDGELSASLQTELHAHRLNCTACQNELALLEACGDVITMDRCEPQVSLSFTDRVVLAQRGQRTTRPRRWGRLVWYIGSPMAAAASIAFTLSVITPPTPRASTAILAEIQAAPKGEQALMLKQSGRTLTADEQRALDQTPQMDGSFLDMLLAPLVEQSKNTLEGTRRSAEDLQLLMRQGFSKPNERLFALWQQAMQEASAESSADQPGWIDDDPFGSVEPPAPPANSSPSSKAKDQPEPL